MKKETRCTMEDGLCVLRNGLLCRKCEIKMIVYLIPI